MSQNTTLQQPDTSVLFQPIKIGTLDLKNRIVMAPMTRGMSPNGIIGEANADYYKRRAEGSVGLILSEGTVINRPASRNEAGIPFFHGTDALNGWKQVIEAVHASGGRMGPQLWHVGSAQGQSGWKPDAEIESPSGLSKADTPYGQAMSDEDIADTIAAFASAASDAKQLGFDTIELHGAHGYLIDQFLWAVTNQRKDQWGGETLPERNRFAVEVVRAVRAAVGPDFPILLRISQWKQQDYTAKLAASPDELEAWLTPLADAGVDIFHCSQRRFWDAEFPEIDGANGLNFAGWTKKLTAKATISVGSVGLGNDFFSAFSGEASNTAGMGPLIQRMERDEFDLIAVGRALLTDGQWAEKIRTGKSSELLGFEPASLGMLT